VLIIYLLQVGLVLLAFFMRFELDSGIVLAFLAFAGSVLSLLYWAAREGWRLNQLSGPSGLRQHLNEFRFPKRIAQFALGAMGVCLALYALTVVISVTKVGSDIGRLCVGILLLLILLSSWNAERSLQWLVRGAAYFSVVLLVYLDQTMPHRTALLTVLGWSCIAITGAAALVRFLLSPARRFELTTLDLIVIFIGLVLPNLPGSLDLPADLPGGVAKTVILLYVVEMMLAANLQQRISRLFLGVTLAAIAGRAFLPFAI
jgi:UDP-GlcNAc:undecaprenyl-phosphate/decaprenyl-phosphate GlcNAc-1-phosphate transferase